MAHPIPVMLCKYIVLIGSIALQAPVDRHKSEAMRVEVVGWRVNVAALKSGAFTAFTACGIGVPGAQLAGLTTSHHPKDRSLIAQSFTRKYPGYPNSSTILQAANHASRSFAMESLPN